MLHDLAALVIFQDLAVLEINDLVGYVQDPFLMADDHDGTGGLPVQLFKDLDQALEAPQVNARFRFIEQGQGCPPGCRHGNLDPLHFAAGQGIVQLSSDIFFGIQAYRVEGPAGLIEGLCPFFTLFPAGGQLQQVSDPESLEPDRLLEREADALPGPLRDGKIRYILAIQQDTAGIGRDNAHDDLEQGRFAAAVGACDGNKVIIQSQIDVLQDLLVIRRE